LISIIVSNKLSALVALIAYVIFTIAQKFARADDTPVVWRLDRLSKSIRLDQPGFWTGRKRYSTHKPN